MPSTVSDKEMDALCRQSIQSYLDLKGIPYTQDANYLRLKDHDSLVVDTRITPNKPYETFYWNSQGVGGNLFHFLRYYENYSGKDALSLLEKMGPALAKHQRTIPKVETIKKVYQPYKHRGVKYPKRSLEYFTKVRKLSPKLVNAMYRTGLVRELPNGNAFFVWYDHKMKEVGGDEQGTYINHQKFGKRGTKKKVAWGSQKDLGFHFSCNFGNAPQRLYVFESPIDALSFAQMHGREYPGKQRFLSINGAGTKVETLPKFIADFANSGVPAELHICFDTDKAGFKGVNKAKERYDWMQSLRIPAFEKMKFVVDQPPTKYKDWNEQLQKGIDHELKSQSYDKYVAENKDRFPEEKETKLHSRPEQHSVQPKKTTENQPDSFGNLYEPKVQQR